MTVAAEVPYPWVEPSSSKTEGRYRITTRGRVGMIYMVALREHLLMAIRPHLELVAMVGATRRAHGEGPSGNFYINEWRHVLIKAGGHTWYAGTYDPILEFDLDGMIISARASRSLRPGDRWSGPQVGIRYTLAASGSDIYCRRRIDNNTERQEKLSDYMSDVTSLVGPFYKYRPSGGRLYINEAREIYSPGVEPGSFVYLGYAPLDRWFPEPRPDR